MTQKQLAKKSGLTQQYISDLEKGMFRSKSPTLKTIRDIAKALNVCAFALIGPDDDCCMDCTKCNKSMKIHIHHIHEDLANFTESLEKISKKNNISLSELLNKSLELINKEYPD